MTLFGQTLDGQQIFGVVSLIAVLALWLIVLARQRDHVRQIKRWKKEQAARNAPPPAAGYSCSPPLDSDAFTLAVVSVMD